jgi:tRNA G18 (ribose-2'-O)-methylase SpoU
MKEQLNNRGYFGIGIEHTKNELNIGTLYRTAHIFGAAFIFTIGKRYKKQGSDTTKSYKHIPLYHYLTFDEFYKNMPFDCRLVGIEIADNAIPIREYKHPERCIYLLGAEDHGLSTRALKTCHDIIVLPGNLCLNVSTSGSIVLFDRINKYNLD